MSTVRMRTNVKLAKLLYKYADESKDREEEIKEEEVTEDQKEYDSYPPYNFTWFIEKKIAAMGWPQTVANLNYIVDQGVNHLITFSPERWPPILECKKKLKWTEIAIKEFGAPTLKQILKFIEICERAQMRGEVLGVHCRQGRGRTGTMLACYLVYYKNMAPERAILTVRVQRPGSCETYEQEKIVCHYHDCLRGTVTKPDYRLVDDKLYFDCSMKHMYDENEEMNENKITNEGSEGATAAAASREESKQNKVTLKMEKKKSKAMVINHNIYF